MARSSSEIQQYEIQNSPIEWASCKKPRNWTLSNWIILRSFPREMWLQYVIYEITIGKNCSIIALFIDSYPVTVVFLVSWNCKAKPLFIVQLTIRDSLGAFDTPSVWGNLNSNSCCYFRCISICLNLNFPISTRWLGPSFTTDTDSARRGAQRIFLYRP